MELGNNKIDIFLEQEKFADKMKNLKYGESIKIFMEVENRSIEIETIWGAETRATLHKNDTETLYSSGKVTFEDSADLISDVLVFFKTGVVNSKFFKEIPAA
jgi:hypothetical protein